MTWSRVSTKKRYRSSKSPYVSVVICKIDDITLGQEGNDLDAGNFYANLCITFANYLVIGKKIDEPISK